MIFGGNTLYATPALLASGVMVALYRAGYPSYGVIATTFVGAFLTLAARWRGWKLPEAGREREGARRTRDPRPRWPRRRRSDTREDAGRSEEEP